VRSVSPYRTLSRWRRPSTLPSKFWLPKTISLCSIPSSGTSIKSSLTITSTRENWSLLNFGAPVLSALGRPCLPGFPPKNHGIFCRHSEVPLLHCPPFHLRSAPTADSRVELFNVRGTTNETAEPPPGFSGSGPCI